MGAVGVGSEGATGSRSTGGVFHDGSRREARTRASGRQPPARSSLGVPVREASDQDRRSPCAGACRP